MGDHAKGLPLFAMLALAVPACSSTWDGGSLDCAVSPGTSSDVSECVATTFSTVEQSASADALM
jgi:hypothetical protein